MERKDDAMIRRKVLGLESEPVVLDRERLWRSISFPASRREPRSLIYYAAASVALAWAFVFILQELSRRDQLQVRLNELELSIQSEITRVSLTAAPTAAEIPCKMPATIDIVAPSKRIIIRQASVNPLIPKAATVAVQEASSTENSERQVVEETTTPPEPVRFAAQPTPKPRVVLGATFPDNTSNAQGKQRLRLGLFREEERQPSSAPLVTLAGVNNQ